MNKSITLLLAVLALALSQGSYAQQATSRVQTLRGADAAAADQAPPDLSYKGKSPGSQKPLARTFSTQPPVIPHAIEGMDEFTLESNSCLACHGPDNYKNVKAPKVADSHFVDRDGKVLPTISAARYQCTLCHAPQADAKPLVENTFRGDAARAKR